jgi:hypothetical protein
MVSGAHVLDQNDCAWKAGRQPAQQGGKCDQPPRRRSHGDEIKRITMGRKMIQTILPFSVAWLGFIFRAVCLNHPIRLLQNLLDNLCVLVGLFRRQQELLIGAAEPSLA